MPTQPVIERLKELQTELETVSSAVRHIDEAAKVAKTASEFINDLKALEEKYRQELIKYHKDRIEILEKQLQNLLTELKEKSKQFTQLIEDVKKLEKSISDYLAEIKKINFPERLNKIDNQISSINIGVGNLQTAIQNTQTKVDAVQSSVNFLSSKVERKISELEKRIVEENGLLIREIKTNRIISITIGGFLLIGIILIFVLGN